MPFNPEELIFIGICDLGAQVRGKSVPVVDLPARYARGVGYTPANICFSPFGTIGTSPFGTVGDLVLRPDPSAQAAVDLPGGTPLQFVLADILTPAGEPWAFCPRGFLRGALTRLESVAGCSPFVGFEQEFVYTGVEAEPRRGYTLRAFHEQGSFGADLMGALRTANMAPDTFLAEFGPQQFEVTVAPATGLRAADDAVLLREIARAVARAHGHRAIFSPMVDPNGVGNGTHIHISLRDRDGNPVMHDAKRAYGLSALGESFVAGILQHMPALAALTTPSVASYFRLTPNRWAPTWANVSASDRAASLRVCPGDAPQFNVEYRVADATACPYMALGALLHAGADGVERSLHLPAESPVSLMKMTDEERTAAGMRPLPHSLAEALENLRKTAQAPEWLGKDFLDLYLQFKSEEIEAIANLSPAEICNRYADVY